MVVRLGMVVRRLLSIVLCWSGLAAAQLAGNFHLDKDVYASGEPIFLYFEVTNNGREVQKILQADPYSFCSGYDIHLSSDATTSSPCAVMGQAGSCISSTRPLQPGQSHTERILLNFDHKIDIPGEYEVDALRFLPHGDRDTEFFVPATERLEMRARLHFRIDPKASVDANTLSVWVQQLRSVDPTRRVEAGRILAALAPRSLEDILLGFADSPEFRWLAPRAFGELNTPRSMAALAQLLAKSSPGSYESAESAKFLAASGDLKWFPLLEELARKRPRDGNYVQAAAESGGDRSLPLLLDFFAAVMPNSPVRMLSRH